MTKETRALIEAAEKVFHNGSAMDELDHQVYLDFESAISSAKAAEEGVEDKISEAKELLEEARENGIAAHREMSWGCEECAYVSSSLCGRISTFLGET